MQNTIATEKLRDYVKQNEVVSQTFGDFALPVLKAQKLLLDFVLLIVRNKELLPSLSVHTVLG